MRVSFVALPVSPGTEHIAVLCERTAVLLRGICDFPAYAAFYDIGAADIDAASVLAHAGKDLDRNARDVAALHTSLSWLAFADDDLGSAFDASIDAEVCARAVNQGIVSALGALAWFDEKAGTFFGASIDAEVCARALGVDGLDPLPLIAWLAAHGYPILAAEIFVAFFG